MDYDRNTTGNQRNDWSELRGIRQDKSRDGAAWIDHTGVWKAVHTLENELSVSKEASVSEVRNKPLLDN